MILVDSPKRLLTVNWDEPFSTETTERYLAITAVRPHEDPTKTNVKTIRISESDCAKLIEFLISSKRPSDDGSNNNKLTKDKG